MALPDISLNEVRRVALWRQGFLESSKMRGAPAARESTARPAKALGRSTAPAPSTAPAQTTDLEHERAVGTMLARLGAVQLDTISVLARSHELVAYARLGVIDRKAIERAYWSGDQAFEYWSHAACILPMDTWPLFAFRRRFYARRGSRWHEFPAQALAMVRRRLESDGPLTTKELGGAKRGGQWWDWSEAKVAVEYLLDIGEVVCTQRVGWRRVYDLSDRVIPTNALQAATFVDDDGVIGPANGECLRGLIAQAAETIGIGTSADIADVHRLTIAEVERHAVDVGLVRVQVPDWPGRTWATPTALDWLGKGSRPRHRTTLLSPFDSLVWHRQRMERLFGMTHRLEAYTPAAKRLHGYFAMPVLHGGQLVARVDPKREGTTLIAQRVTLEQDARGRVPDSAIIGTARALREAADWVGCDAIRIGQVSPAGEAPALAALT